MARQMKKGNPIVYAVIFCIVGLVFLFQGVRDYIGISGELLNISTCDASEVQNGDWVEATITTGYGAYVEEQSKSRYSSWHTSGYYYLVDVCDKNEDGSYSDDTPQWIGVKIGSGDITTYDNADDDNPVKITGVVKKHSDKIQGYYEDFIREFIEYAYEYSGMTATSEDYEYLLAQAFPYYIKPVTQKGCFGSMVIGGVFLVVGVILLLIGLKKSKNVSYAGTGLGGSESPYSQSTYDQSTYDQSTYGQNTYGQNTYDQTDTYGAASSAAGGQTPYSDPFMNQSYDDGNSSSGSGFSLKND